MRRALAVAWLLSASMAHAEIDGAELVDGYGLSEPEVAGLEQGEALAYSNGEYEFTFIGRYRIRKGANWDYIL